MALFAIHCTDKPDALDIRLTNRPAHLEWAAQFKDQITMAGPLFAEDGETFSGSLFIIEFPDLEEAKRWASEDPYAKAGLFEHVDIRPFRWLIGKDT
ncbi:MAG: YciI family protein [Pseudomonadota bacterium]